jgi:hypothetical protein
MSDALFDFTEDKIRVSRLPKPSEVPVEPESIKPVYETDLELPLPETPQRKYLGTIEDALPISLESQSTTDIKIDEPITEFDLRESSYGEDSTADVFPVLLDSSQPDGEDTSHMTSWSTPKLQKRDRYRPPAIPGKRLISANRQFVKIPKNPLKNPAADVNDTGSSSPESIGSAVSSALSQFKPSNIWAAAMGKAKKLFRSSAIGYIANSGPDWMSNMWDVAIIVSEKSNDAFGIGSWGAFGSFLTAGLATSDLFDWLALSREQYSIINKMMPHGSDRYLLGDAAVLMARCSSIKVPQPKSETYQVRVLDKTLTKVRSKVAFERQGEMEITLDDPLYMLQIFQIISNNASIHNEVSMKQNRIDYNTSPETNWTSEQRTFKTEFLRSSFMSNNIPMSGPWSSLQSGARGKRQIDIIVYHTSLMRKVFNSFAGKDYDTYGLQGDENMCWVFDDVRFLGNTTELEFVRDAAETKIGTFPFTFKRVYRVDRQKRGTGLGGMVDQAMASMGLVQDSTTSLRVDKSSMNSLVYDQQNQNWYYTDNQSIQPAWGQD